ncbi:MAG: hypothetical protein NT154_05625 [Verrucomicrobia bacterium]|nr:hypothetical protein [Verrucomicrobiota bacterium]
MPANSACDAVAGNIDFLPTFAALAGAALPAGAKLDGRDITSLLLGQNKESPHEAYFYFAGKNLQAIRAGPWKLAIARQSENTGARKNAAKPAAPVPAFTPTLYNLDEDTGEQCDVAAQFPEVMNRLQGYVAQMNADLGVTNSGPGVRPPGRVEHPRGLYLPGH